MSSVSEFLNWFEKKLILRVTNWVDKLLLFSAVHLFPEYENGDTVLIFRPDNIGDYVLFRNFLPFIKKSPKYLNKKIILIGNQSWALLSLKYDSQYFDDALFIDQNRFYRNIAYKVAIVRKIRKMRAREAVNTVHSRTLFTDFLVRLSGATCRVTCEGDDIVLAKRKEESDKLYNKIIPSLPATHFEFYRNQFFFKTWLNSSIDFGKPSFPNDFERKRESVVGVFPGASESFRQWGIGNFSTLITMISRKFPHFSFYILGSEKEKKLSFTIISTLPDIRDKLFDYCGKTNLPELVDCISKLGFLITNDTAGLHISIATDTPSICISNGNHFGRFTPYPYPFKQQHEFIYPHPNFYNDELKENLAMKHQRGSDWDINIIEPKTVFNYFLKLQKSVYG